jgi:predicted GIY-YIG superfamily endonuclease
MGAAGAGGWVVYILSCADGTFYTGITTDVDRRCRQHNDGKASRYTRSRRPTRLVYQEPQANQAAALRREAAIKALSRREKATLIRASHRRAP